MKKLTGLGIFLLVGALLALQPFPARSGPLDPYIEAAKKEGAVRIGITLRAKEYGKPSGSKYIAAFQKKYPFLKVEFKRIGGARERERVINEMAGGMFSFDIVPASETMVPVVMAAKLPRIVDWEKLGVPKILAHPENMGLILRTMAYGIAYNRDHVTDQEAKAFTWETCTDPKFKGKNAMDDRPRHLNRFFLEDVWGREKTLDYARRWAANNPSIESSRSTAASKLMAGAYHIICGMQRSSIKELQVYAESKNLGIVFPEPVPIGFGDIIYVPDKAKHPNAGVLFLAWTGTQEAQNLLDEVNFTGHPDFEGNEINQVVKGKKVVIAQWEHLARTDEDLAAILQAMGMPVVRSKKKK
ncbi:MAG: extracellular solute-binding protein [Desulfobacterales bacterium]|nr:extracellular solute-binding protein [Desulfobacterales bacterium]